MTSQSSLFQDWPVGTYIIHPLKEIIEAVEALTKLLNSKTGAKLLCQIKPNFNLTQALTLCFSLLALNSLNDSSAAESQTKLTWSASFSKSTKDLPTIGLPELATKSIP